MKNRIKLIRLKLGMNQGEFARKINIVQQQLSKYERGENKPSSDFLAMLASKTDTNINWLLTGIGEMFVNSQSSNINPEVVEIKPYKFFNNESDEYSDGIFIDLNIVKNVWKRNEKDIVYFKVPADTPVISFNNIIIYPDDIILADTSIKDLVYPGIYSFKVKNSDEIYFNILQPLPDGSVYFPSNDKNTADVTYNKLQLKEFDFTVIGKVFKNISR